MFIFTKEQRVKESNVYCDYRAEYKKTAPAFMQGS